VGATTVPPPHAILSSVGMAAPGPGHATHGLGTRGDGPGARNPLVPGARMSLPPVLENSRSTGANKEQQLTQILAVAESGCS
jgi:hypothetical protein